MLPLGGLAISLWELRKPPRGLPLAGAAVGLIGLLMWTIFLSPYIMWVAGALGLSTEAMANQQTDVAINNAHQTIIDYREEEDAWPDEKKGVELIGDQRDAWNRALRYKSLPDSFEVRSAGPDGKFDNEDDLTDDYIADESDFLDDSAVEGDGIADSDGDGISDETDDDGASGPNQPNSPTAAPNSGQAAPGPTAPTGGRRPPPRNSRRGSRDRMFKGRDLPLIP